MATLRVDRWTGREVRWLREALSVSVRDLAGLLGVSDRTVGKWEAAGLDANLRISSQGLLHTLLLQAREDQRQAFADMLAAYGPGNDRVSSAQVPQTR